MIKMNRQDEKILEIVLHTKICLYIGLLVVCMRSFSRGQLTSFIQVQHPPAAKSALMF